MDKRIYQTTDINLTATLLTLGFEVLTINPVNPNRILFLFDEGKYSDIQKSVADYWSNQIIVNPKDLFMNRRELLTRVKEAQRNIGDSYENSFVQSR